MIAIHRFLLMVAKPVLQAPVDAVKSLNEIIRVTKHECAIMLMRGDMLIGTLGLIKADWWYADASFLTDRWHFVLPQLKNTSEAKMLKAEALAIAANAGLKFLDNGKVREGKQGDLMLMPRIYEPRESH